MIRTETEYQNALLRVRESEDALRKEKHALSAQGRTKHEIKRATDPSMSFLEQLREEIASYERLRQGDFEELKNLEGMGRLLIALRIFQSLSQRELAEKLGVHESQVSRDERNEYQGVTVERANRILEALGAELRTNITMISNTRNTSPKSESILVGS